MLFIMIIRLFKVMLQAIDKIPVYAPVYGGIRYATVALLAKGEDRLFECRVEFPSGERASSEAVHSLR